MGKRSEISDHFNDIDDLLYPRDLRGPRHQLEMGIPIVNKKAVVPQR